MTAKEYPEVDRRQYVNTATCLARQEAITNSVRASSKIFETEVKSIHSSLAEMSSDLKKQGEVTQQLHDQLLIGNGSEAIKVQVARNTTFREEMVEEKSLLRSARRGIWMAVLVALISGGFTIWAAVIGKWP